LTAGQATHLGAGQSGHLRRQDEAAVAALHLAEPAHQPHAAAPAALVEVRLPVVHALAGRADQDLLIAPDAAPPRAMSPYRVHLPRATAIAGHRVPFLRSLPGGLPAPSPVRRAPSDTRRCHAPRGV